MFDDELASIRTQPPRTGVLPGMRLRSAVPRSTLILLIAFIALFAVFPLSIISTDPMMRLNIGPSRDARGQVLSVTPVSACGSSVAHRILYTFSAGSGSTFRGTTTVCEQSPYSSVQAGDSVDIRYLDRDPSVNTIAGANPDNAPPLAFFMIFPLFFLLVLSPLYFPQIREVIRARRLYKTGLLAQGKVVFVKKRNAGTWPGFPGNSMADVYVAHDLPQGGRRETIVWCSNDWLLHQLSPGTTVHILLPADSSARGALLEAFIR